jgi:hypothetical protein
VGVETRWTMETSRVSHFLHLASIGHGRVSTPAHLPLFEATYRLELYARGRLLPDLWLKMPLDHQYAVGVGPLLLTLPDGLRLRFDVPEHATPDDQGFVRVRVTDVDMPGRHVKPTQPPASRWR